MARVKSLTSVYGLKVYTEKGEFFGVVEDAIIEGNRIVLWKIANVKGSLLEKVSPNAKGAIIEHKYVKAIADIMIISSVIVPTTPEESEVIQAESVE